MTLPDSPAGLTALIESLAHLLQQLRLTLVAVVGWFRRSRPPAAYEPVWLDLVLDLTDPQGERAVLTRRQRVRFLADGGAVVRELVWGKGDQLVRYHARGARRLAVRPEGSKRAVLLDPDS